MKTLLNFLSNLLNGLMKLFNLIGSLSLALTLPVILICFVLGNEEWLAYAVTFMMVLFGIAVLLPDDGNEC